MLWCRDVFFCWGKAWFTSFLHGHSRNLFVLNCYSWSLALWLGRKEMIPADLIVTSMKNALIIWNLVDTRGLSHHNKSRSIFFFYLLQKSSQQELIKTFEITIEFVCSIYYFYKRLDFASAFTDRWAAFMAFFLSKKLRTEMQMVNHTCLYFYQTLFCTWDSAIS